MRERHIKKAGELAVLVMLKFSSMALTAFALIFLTLAGGLESVGRYSSVTAVTAPLVMFLSFRNVEWMSLSSDKKMAFSTAVSVAFVGFSFAAPLVYVEMDPLIGDNYFLASLLVFKAIEIISEMLVVVYTTSGFKKMALISIYAKLACAALLSVTFVFILKMQVLRGVAAAMLVSYLGVISIYDYKNIRSMSLFSVPRLGSFIEYVRKNFGYGALNMAISVNSSMPRYFLIYRADMTSVGAFSLMYQIAATMVNVIQYPVSVKVVRVSAMVEKWVRPIKVAILSVGIIAIVTLTITSMLTDGGASTRFGRWLLYGLLIALMFLPLVIRGGVLTAAIGCGKTRRLYGVVVVSMATAVISAVIFKLIVSGQSDLYACVVYVVISSCVSAWQLANRLDKRRLLRQGA
jgi:hypothetical protein